MNSFTLNKKITPRLKSITVNKILKKLLFLIPNLFGVIISPIIVFFIRIIRPFVLIRYGLILSTRIGHFTENLDLYLCYKKKTYTIQILKIIKKKFLIFFIVKRLFATSFFLRC